MMKRPVQRRVDRLRADCEVTSHVLRAYRMIPQEERRSKLITLEVARFVAALCVVLHHLGGIGFQNEIGPRVMDAPGPAAVMFFFSLSGFVIYSAHWQDAGKPHRLPRYFWRRLWRIYPIYWLSLVPILPFFWDGCTRDYLAQIFSLIPTPQDFSEINPPAWTLRYELTFYVMFGLSLLPYLRRVLLPAWFGLIVWAWYGPPFGLSRPPEWMINRGGIEYHLFSLFNCWFFAGVAAGWLFVRYLPPPCWRWPLLGASAVFMAVMLWLDQDGYIFPPNPILPFNAMSFAAIIYALAAVERSGQLRLNRRWAILGAMSYPLYLLHYGVGSRFTVYFFHHPGAAHHFTDLSLFLTVVASSLLCTWLAAVVFDQPLQRLARRVM